MSSDLSPRPVSWASGYNVGAGWRTRSSLLVALGFTGALAACTSESPVGPAAPPAHLNVVLSAEVTTSTNSATLVNGLTRTRPLANDLRTTATIGPLGGAFAIPAAGLKVLVPPGAVASPTVFTATALAGDMVAYDFGPHGATFAVPLQVIQELGATNWKSASQIEGGYFAENSQLNDATDQAVVNELLPVSIDVFASKLRMDVWHFSGYMVSSGRL